MSSYSASYSASASASVSRSSSPSFSDDSENYTDQFSSVNDVSENYTDQFSSFDELYEFVLISGNDEKIYDEGKPRSHVYYKLPLYMDALFKSYNLYINWDNIIIRTESCLPSPLPQVPTPDLIKHVSPNIPISENKINFSEDIIEVLLHLEIELKNSFKYLRPSDKSYQLAQQQIDIIDKLAGKFGYSSAINSQSKNETGERTDKKLIPDDKIHCLNISSKLMKSLIQNEALANEHNDLVFNHPKCYPANKTLRSNNYYGLDKLGIVIRREFFNSKSKPFSWKYLDGKTIPISYFYNSCLSDEENINQILSRQYQLQPGAFTKPSGVIYKIYSHDPELYQRYINFMNSKLK